MLSVSEIAAQVISFLILLAIMRAFLWKPFLAALDNRKAAVAADLKSAEEIKSESEKLRLMYAQKIEKIDEEARAKIQIAVNEGLRAAQEIREKAAKDSEKIFDNAKTNIKAELSKAKEELKETVVDLTIEVAEKVIQEKLSEDSDKRLVEEFIKELGAR